MLSVLLAVAITGQTPVPKHLAETIYEGRIETARKKYEAEVQAARKDLKDSLERATTDATKRGDLDKAVAYRERAKAAGTEIVGKYEIRYVNGGVRHYLFQTDGSMRYVYDSSSDALLRNPLEAGVFWTVKGDTAIGLVALNQCWEVFTVSGGKLTTLIFLRENAVSGEAVKIK